MSPSLDITASGQKFTLLGEKAIYWGEQKTLLLSDVHAGKATLFRDNGIPLSTDHLLRDLDTISSLCKRLDIQKICILGDLYHTTYNPENKLIDDWLHSLEIEIELVVGNHDIHSIRKSGIPSRLPYELNGIMLSHEPTDSAAFNICGHLHPAITLSGKGRQHIKMPAFYHSLNQLTLPAFGSLNGARVYEDLVNKSDVYGVSDFGIIKI